MSTGSTGHDAEIEALVVDRYLESLLARRPIEIDGVPPELDATARRLAGALPRFHPSFRFEEALSARLAAVAGRIAGGEVVAFPSADVEPALLPVPFDDAACRRTARRSCPRTARSGDRRSSAVC